MGDSHGERAGLQNRAERVRLTPPMPSSPRNEVPALTDAADSPHPDAARRLRVYVASPYTQGDVAANVAAAMDAADTLIRAGFAPFVPHLSHFQHMMHPHPYDTWIALDLCWLEVCDALVRLPGPSAGADAEVEWCVVHGVPVFDSVRALIHSQQEAVPRRRQPKTSSVPNEAASPLHQWVDDVADELQDAIQRLQRNVDRAQADALEALDVARRAEMAAQQARSCDNA